ncbi:hypothetical protein ENUP19_0167G0012 [Entamoeba nuttalli]|uniref:Uncharacterized protein n=1 Tax=Entamoeba nuttalli TaxID=412467 RepID=A0ABQ0DM98_9EUKA
MELNPDKELGDYEDEYHIKTLLKEQNECIDDGKQVKEELLTSSIESNNSETLKTDRQSSMITQNSGDEKCKKVDELKEEINQVEARIKNITFTQNQKTIDMIKQLKKFIHDVKEVFEFVNNELNERYLNEWKEKKCGEYIRCANCHFQ